MFPLLDYRLIIHTKEPDDVGSHHQWGNITDFKAIKNAYEERGWINAIKVHRTQTKMSLKGSKDAVENMARWYGWKKPTVIEWA